MPIQIMVAHPLFFRPAARLPERLPRMIVRGHKTDMIALVHHDGSPKHWTLARFRTVGRVVQHYDPWPSRLLAMM
ncbi:sentrin SUMO-specific [Colletotrichum tofieldiae]|nr:sentrin SUMO-specific [Colletotrichum tofieldiae]GKT81656.1 sentrin SUMO-specific [Colletotrichum tofieldiae]GKT97628.1 sentrin SUMO-specific [Colletotrichum tofieldiae]